ncbi:fibrinogen alpha chain-like [Discoglossus pictus]
MKRADNAMQSCVVNIFRYQENLSGIKQVYEVTRENMLMYQDAFWNFVRTGNEIQKRLTALNLKVKMQVEKIQGLLSSIEDQLAVMKRLEVDMDIKMRSCQGSCRNFHPYMVNMNNYTIWNRNLSIINISQIDQIKDLHKFNISSAQINITSLVESTPVIEGKQLDLFEDIQQQVLKLEDQNDYYNETNSVV